MDPDFDGDFPLADSCVAVVGLGLLGGSLALGLRGHCAKIIGVDPDIQALEQALSRRIVDEGSTGIAGLNSQADVIILAAPVQSIIELIACLPQVHPASAVVLDVGSTKARIVQAMEGLPARFDPLGGHPMAGKEKLSLAHADAQLFQDAVFAFCPLPRTSLKARTFAVKLCRILQSKPLWMDAALHDRWVAATSHVPYLLSAALASGTPQDSAPLVGPGFRSTSRLAATPTSMMMDVLQTNQANILESLLSVRARLDEIEELFRRGDFEALKVLLDAGRERQRALTLTPQEGKTA